MSKRNQYRKATIEFLLWRRDSSSNSRAASASGDLMPTITGYAQALYSTYNAKRISMSGRRWNPFGMEGGPGVDVRRGTADDEYEGRSETIIEMEMPLT